MWKITRINGFFRKIYKILQNIEILAKTFVLGKLNKIYNFINLFFLIFVLIKCVSVDV